MAGKFVRLVIEATLDPSHPAAEFAAEVEHMLTCELLYDARVTIPPAPAPAPPPAYAEQAARFALRHGFPAPPENQLAALPEWPLPFCGECCDWHQADQDHSA